MAKHRAPKPRPWRMIIAAAASLLLAGGLAVAVPASANTPPLIGQLTTSGDDGYDAAACSFTVQGVDEAHGTVTAQMGGQSKPVPGNLLGYLQIAHNEITCTLYGPSGQLLTQIHNGANTANVGTSIQLRTVPEYPYYELCGLAKYTLRSGSAFFVDAGCAFGPS